MRRAKTKRWITDERNSDAKDRVDLVHIDAFAGSWDRAEVEVTGTIGERVERVDVNTSAGHTTVRVVLPQVSHFMQVPLRTSVKFPHSPHISPS